MLGLDVISRCDIISCMFKDVLCRDSGTEKSVLIRHS